MLVKPHTRTVKKTKNSKQEFKKMTELRGRKYQAELDRQLQLYPVDWIINKHNWYHLDKIRNKLYHQQYMTLWKYRLNQEEYEEIFQNQHEYYPVRRQMERKGYFDWT